MIPLIYKTSISPYGKVKAGFASLTSLDPYDREG